MSAKIESAICFNGYGEENKIKLVLYEDGKRNFIYMDSDCYSCKAPITNINFGLFDLQGIPEGQVYWKQTVVTCEKCKMTQIKKIRIEGSS